MFLAQRTSLIYGTTAHLKKRGQLSYSVACVLQLSDNSFLIQFNLSIVSKNTAVLMPPAPSISHLEAE